jgi:tetratricopeptide (TPR) repeat protein
LNAASAFRTVGDIEAAAEAEMFAATCFWGVGQGDAADTASERALELVRNAPASRAKAMVLVDRSRLLMLRSRFREAIELGREGLALAEDLGLVRLQISGLVAVGTALTALAEGGVTDLERAIELGRGGVAPSEVQRAYNNLAEERVAGGHLRDAVQHYAEGRAEIERFGIVAGLQWVTAQEAVTAWMLGDWSRADELRREHEDLLADAQGHYLENQILLMQSEMAQARGESADALAFGERGLTHARGVKDPQALGPSLASYARVLVANGRHEEARDLVDELLTQEGEGGEVLYFYCLIDLGWLLHDLGRSEEVPPAPRARVWSEVGQALARGQLVTAAELLASTDLASYEAYARLRAAEQLASEGRNIEAQPHLQRALAFYRSVGATAYLRRAEAVMPASA